MALAGSSVFTVEETKMTKSEKEIILKIDTMAPVDQSTELHGWKMYFLTLTHLNFKYPPKKIISVSHNVYLEGIKREAIERFGITQEQQVPYRFVS